MFVLLTGPAAVRKSTAMNTANKYLLRGTNVRIAPDDTAGRRQGLISAMLGDVDTVDQQDLAELDRQLEKTLAGDFASLGDMHIDLEKARLERTHDADSQCMHVAASEFNSFVGHGNIEFLEFLVRVYDCERYSYKLKGQPPEVLEQPALSLLGCTTPTNIATALPAEAIGQGFTSRIIFVYGGKKYKSVARPAKFDERFEKYVTQCLSHVYYNMSGELQETDEARQYVDHLYERASPLTDSRFTYYLSRRHTHLLKLAMCFAVARSSMTIEVADYVEADALLKLTEQHMPDALGEYGMDKLASAKQTLVETIRMADAPVTVQTLWAIMHRDMRQHELSSCILDLVTAEKIQQVKTADGKVAYIPVMAVSDDTSSIVNLITGGA